MYYIQMLIKNLLNLDASTVAEGIVIGVSGSLVAAAILGAFGFLKVRYEYRNQRKHITHTIAAYRNRIYSAQAVEVAGISCNVDEVRYAIFKEFQRSMILIQQGRSQHISFDRQQDVFDKLAFFDEIYPKVRLNLQGYRDIFKELENLKWLRLDKLPVAE